MANHKSAQKRIRQNAKRRTHNRHYRATMRTEIKKLMTAIDAGDTDAAKAQLPGTVGLIQRVAQKGIIHRRQAARRVSRLAGKVNALSA
jgi:small subunit ribosomal protein S20